MAPRHDDSTINIVTGVNNSNGEVNMTKCPNSIISWLISSNSRHYFDVKSISSEGLLTIESKSHAYQARCGDALQPAGE